MPPRKLNKKKTVGITLSLEEIEKINKLRGLVTVSAYIGYLIKKEPLK